MNGSEEELNCSGADSISVQLQEYDNEIEFTFAVSEHLHFRKGGKIWTDWKAPTLFLYEVGSTPVSTTKSEYILVGKTASGCIVKIGEELVTVDENGGFTVTLPLKAGKNSFTVTAQSGSGNVTTQSFTVERKAIAVVQEGDIDASCGQLRRKYTRQTAENQ